MHTTGWIAAGLSGLLGAWLCFDGLRALVVGDYVTPRTGRYAGQLGPWSATFRALGIDPRSTPVKMLHVAVGAALIASVVLIMVSPRLGWRCLLASCVCALWYLPFGTLAMLIALVLLLLPGSHAWAPG